MELTQSIIKELLNYDSSTGVFTWKRRSVKYFKSSNLIAAWNSRFSGMVAGSINPEGYRVIRVFNKANQAHRLAWLYVFGEWPEGCIDHANQAKDDNRISNLRCVTHTENQRNKPLYKRNKSGVCGVNINKKTGKWRAVIFSGENTLWLGSHEDWFEAVCARKSAEIKHGFHENHGKRLIRA